MKCAVLMAVDLESCMHIFNDDHLVKKTVILRKGCPKIRIPYKVYVYCTQGRSGLGVLTLSNDINTPLNGKVIGEFVCDRIEVLKYGKSYNELGVFAMIKVQAEMNAKEVVDYATGNGRREPCTLYGWHISNPMPYDRPKDVSDFKTLWGEKITRFPIKWYYVEEQRE